MKRIVQFLLVVLLVVLAVIAVGLVIDPKQALETEVMIDAPPEVVWDVITDGSAYGQWSVFIEGIKGTLEEGATVEVALNAASAEPMTLLPRLLVVRTGQELRWLGQVGMPNVFDGEHYFILEPVEDGTRVIHGERFDGILIPFFPIASYEGDFTRFNAALKARAESLAPAAAQAP